MILGSKSTIKKSEIKDSLGPEVVSVSLAAQLATFAVKKLLTAKFMKVRQIREG
jgi:hypothetical protein